MNMDEAQLLLEISKLEA
jgi:hypothetical protein